MKNTQWLFRNFLRNLIYSKTKKYDCNRNNSGFCTYRIKLQYKWHLLNWKNMRTPYLNIQSIWVIFTKWKWSRDQNSCMQFELSIPIHFNWWKFSKTKLWKIKTLIMKKIILSRTYRRHRIVWLIRSNWGQSNWYKILY